MWKILGPIILLVIVLLFQLQVQESFVTSTKIDASGNITDASGTVLKSSEASSTISLTLADLLSLFKTANAINARSSSTSTATAPTATASTSILPSSTSSSTDLTPAEFYNQLRPDLIKDITGIANNKITGSTYQPSAPLPCDNPISDSAAQGVELQNVLKDYVKRDEIPCYGCTL